MTVVQWEITRLPAGAAAQMHLGAVGMHKIAVEQVRLWTEELKRRLDTGRCCDATVDNIDGWLTVANETKAKIDAALAAGWDGK